MDLETLTNPGLYVLLALIVGMWWLGSYFKKVEKRFREKGLD